MKMVNLHSLFYFACDCKKQSRVIQLYSLLKGQFETAGRRFVCAAETAI